MQGGCFCGAVRYRLHVAPMFVQCCHCRDCQQQTGGPFVVNGQIETDRIELLSGAPVPVRMPTGSGRIHDVYRCAACQTALWSDYGGRPALRFLRMMTLDAREAVVPDAHIFTRSKLPWLRLPEGVPAFDIYYDMNVQWPAASLARRRSILGDG